MTQQFYSIKKYVFLEYDIGKMAEHSMKKATKKFSKTGYVEIKINGIS